MSNIKHNDELLRVHDDGFDVVFNCDNKHQNGVSYHAEKNGKKTKIDPEYAMATLVKKISGGGWPAELPKPSVGGYGYTDEDNTVHKINEKYLPESGGGAEQFLVKISGYGNALTTNHTSAEIATAFNNGKYIVATWNENIILQLAWVHSDICRFVGLREGWLSSDEQYVEGCSYAEVTIQGDAVTGFDNYINFSYFQPKN